MSLIYEARGGSGLVPATLTIGCHSANRGVFLKLIFAGGLRMDSPACMIHLTATDRISGTAGADSGGQYGE